MALRYTLGKDERLKRGQHIETLFRTGKAFSAFPVRIVWRCEAIGNERFPTRAGFSVPKKKFKHAVDRNRIKRLLREAWRLNKHTITPLIPPQSQLHLFLIFTDGTLPDQEKITTAVLKGISKLRDHLTGELLPTTASL